MRKMVWATAAYALTIFLMHYILPAHSLYGILFICVAVGGITMLVCRGKLRTGILLICVFSVLGAARYDLQVLLKIDAVEPYIGNEYRISAVVTEYPVVNEDYTKLTVRLKTDGMPELKATLYDYTDSRTACIPGDYIRANVKFNSALTSAGEDTDTYIANGVYLRGYITDEIKIIESRSSQVLFYPQMFGQWVRETLGAYLSEPSSAFMNALLTGEKTALYSDPALYNSLSRAGIAHVVAVSGMHVSFVLGVCMLLFGNRRGWLLSIIFMVLFAVMTGLSPSVLRAVFMQLLFLLAPVLRREADGLTTLAFPLLILLTVNPFAIASTGLQLSFLAMLGIILITPRASEWFAWKCPAIDGLPLKFYRFVTVSLSTSLGASLFTVPVCAYYFGSISLLSPLTNLLVLWIVPYCFSGGFILCALSLFSKTAAALFANVVEWGVSFIFGVAKFISATPFAALYLPEHLMLVWFIVVYAVIGIMFFFKRNGHYRPTIPIITAVVTLAALYSYTYSSNNDGLTVAAVDVGQGQCIAVLDRDRTLMVDCGGAYDAGDRAVRWLYSHGRTEVDLLILSHFDEDHVNGVIDLITQIPVSELLFCGNNLTTEEVALFDSIKQQAENSGTVVRIVNSHSTAQLGSMYLDLFVSPGDTDNDGLIVSLRSGDYRMLVMGDADLDAEAYLLRSASITDGDCLVVGHHGSQHSTGEALLERFDPEYAIISCGYNPYGHPTQEVLDRLTDRNVVIYRTDQMGSIEVKVR